MALFVAAKSNRRGIRSTRIFKPKHDKLYLSFFVVVVSSLHANLTGLPPKLHATLTDQLYFIPASSLVAVQYIRAHNSAFDKIDKQSANRDDITARRALSLSRFCLIPEYAFPRPAPTALFTLHPSLFLWFN